jgi:hypothetical protein
VIFKRVLPTFYFLLHDCHHYHQAEDTKRTVVVPAKMMMAATAKMMAVPEKMMAAIAKAAAAMAEMAVGTDAEQMEWIEPP